MVARPPHFACRHCPLNCALCSDSLFKESGDAQSSVWSCGQSIGLIDDVPSVAALIERIMAQANAIIRERLHGMGAAWALHGR